MHQHQLVCTRTHHIGALILVVTTFFVTRILDRQFLPCIRPSQDLLHRTSHGQDEGGGDLPWPRHGYGDYLHLKIYVYDDHEIDGLKALMYGRDGTISPKACLKGQWGTQVKIHKLLLQSRFRTTNKEEADLFFVPAYAKCVRMLGGLNDKEINATYVKVDLQLIAFAFFLAFSISWFTFGLLFVLSQMPYFRLSGGRNHIFVFPRYISIYIIYFSFGLEYLELFSCLMHMFSLLPIYSGAGAHLFRSWATYINRSIILTPEVQYLYPMRFLLHLSYKPSSHLYTLMSSISKARKIFLNCMPNRRTYTCQNVGVDVADFSFLEVGDRTDKKDTSAFNTWKDIIIPGNIEDGMTMNEPPIVQPLPLSKRKYLANYLGRAQGKIGRLKLIELGKQFPDKLECPDLKFSGHDKLGRTEYFEHLRNSKFCLAPHKPVKKCLSALQECVPVILSDQAELPFQNVIDYTQISIKWPSTQIGPQLLQYLESIPDEDIEGMISLGRKVRCLWVYASDSAPCSAMQGILWELQRKVRQFHQSAETFWLHNGSFIDRNFVKFSDWKPPIPLP
ncbi:hypothetical protein FEM48_Zijuj05G0191000 [Ziziphus jujuba var. spinosa]|uniref:Exostosin GT47 domain-containing protein n=1 Tax=Ziziphus jujuba var. spinosa TaxID=714518 RepID=A0A978VGL6_ZIZJJ|nr:hypothetical protein FEM48_Zijuj05G0191000 [Ziziphus jujuba var. spinosa]